MYLTVFNQFNKLSNDEKTTILCCEADVLKEIIHEGVEPGDYYDYFKDYKIIGQCTPLKRIIAKNREAIPELIKSIETLSINNQAKIWQKETPFISKYPDEVKSGFYLFRLKEKISAFEGKQNKPAYKQAYLEANTLYEALIKDRDENKCRNWINLIETAKKETTLTQHRGMKDIFIGLLLFPYALYKLYKGTFFKEPFTRTRTTIILDELSNVTSNAA